MRRVSHHFLVGIHRVCPKGRRGIHGVTVLVGKRIHVTGVTVITKFSMGNITRLRARVLRGRRLGSFCRVVPRGFGGGAGKVAREHFLTRKGPLLTS